MFGKLLIANRGEIACRLIRTARRLGIATVAVYSDADRDALHVSLADEAIHIGAAPVAESYLHIERILAACNQTQADAVHPGYGFLSENYRFATAVEQAGMTFVGPNAHAIQVMGDKIASKRLAIQAGVNVIPGHDGALADSSEALERAHEIGYPVMLKASSGGGGKGLRIVRDDSECKQGFERARSEADSSFGDDRILIEKFINEPRHIEIQLIGDTHGNRIHLNERECSIQRRHQKIVEETPSLLLDSDLRRAMGEQALALAEIVDYHSAGTVEFIVDLDRHFYFLEMNTRLQVEHAVTELVTELDLVELMLRVAAGETLPVSQEDVRIKGWAIEARLYAEDPYRNFLPSIGRLTRYSPPVEESSVRIDSGVIEGSEIGTHYDPMMAKLITHGKDRKAAIDAMCLALHRFSVEGVSTNIPFLAHLFSHPRFVEGRLSTQFLEDEYPEGLKFAPLDGAIQTRAAALAAVLDYRTRDRVSRQVVGASKRLIVRINGERFDTVINAVADGYYVEVNGVSCTLAGNWYHGQSQVQFTADGKFFHAQVRREGFRYRLFLGGGEMIAQVLDPEVDEVHQLMPIKEPPDKSHYLLSPMPGLLVALSVVAGQLVKAGDELAVVEAMKMENSLTAEREAVVSKLHSSVGQVLEQDQPILEFERFDR